MLRIRKGRRGVITKGVLSLEELICRISNFPRISRNRSDSPLFSTVWGFSRISTFSRISRKWTPYPKDPLFRTPCPISKEGDTDASECWAHLNRGRCERVLHFMGREDAFKTFLLFALCREFRDMMRILMTILGKIHRNPSSFGCFGRLCEL